MSVATEAPAPPSRVKVADPAPLRDYKDRLGNIPESKFLGSILYYTVAGGRGEDTGGVKVHAAVLREWFEELGISERFLPPTIKKIDAFRNAASKTRFEYDMPDTEPGSQVAELSIREVKSDSEQVVRHVIRIVRDRDHEQLSLDHMATIKFIRGGRTARGKRSTGDHVKWQKLSRVKGVESEHVLNLIDQFLERYDDLSEHLHAPALRGVVRRILASYQAVAMKSSAGLYFVHRNQWPNIDKLATFIARIGPHCQLESMPLLDTAGWQASVKEALESEVVEECDKLLQDIARINAESANGLVAGPRYAEIWSTYQEVSSRVEYHIDLIDNLVGGKAANALATALDQVMAMSDRIAPTRQVKRSEQ